MRVQTKPEVNSRVLDGRYHQSLSPCREYCVVGYDETRYRVVNDRGEPVLYPTYLFHVTDSRQPSEWVREEFPDGSFYVDPPECSRPGFYEAWHDGDPETRAIFARVFRRLCEQGLNE